MKDITRYQGVIPAFYACYDDNGQISPERVEEYTRFLVRKGVKGVYVGGSSGECIYQSVADRKLLLEHVVAAAGGKLTIIAHVACNNTADSAELARHAESLGVDAIASIPPIYFRLPEHAIAKYWNDISAAAPETLKNPNVIGVKNSSMPVQDIQMFKYEGSLGGRPFVVFNGPDEQLISGLMMGADGGIGGTYSSCPELYLKLYDLVQAGDYETARALQYDINNIIYALCSCKGNMYAAIKAVLKKREGLELGGVRAPLINLVPEDASIIDKIAAMIDEAVAKYL